MGYMLGLSRCRQVSIHRLYRLYERATAGERYTGRTWYRDAQLDITDLAVAYKTTTDITAGVVAALSPNTRWVGNLEDADRVLSIALAPYSTADYQECRVSTYNLNKFKAFSIAELAWNGSGDVLDILSGPKVTAFYRNLIGDSSALTLDSHAYNAFCGFRATGSDLPGMRAQLTRDARAAYTQASVVKGETVSAFQAIIWVTWKARIDAGKVAGYTK